MKYSQFKNHSKEDIKTINKKKKNASSDVSSFDGPINGHLEPKIGKTFSHSYIC